MRPALFLLITLSFLICGCETIAPVSVPKPVDSAVAYSRSGLIDPRDTHFEQDARPKPSDEPSESGALPPNGPKGPTITIEHIPQTGPPVAGPAAPLTNTGRSAPVRAKHLETRRTWRPASFGTPSKIRHMDASPLGGGKDAIEIGLAKPEQTEKATKIVIELTDPPQGHVGEETVLSLDIFSPNQGGGAVAVGVRSNAPPGDYFESEPKRIKKGWNRNVKFFWNRKAWKCRDSSWQFNRTGPAGPLTSLLILVYRPAEAGRCAIENIAILPAAQAK